MLWYNLSSQSICALCIGQSYCLSGGKMLWSIEEKGINCESRLSKKKINKIEIGVQKNNYNM